MCELHYSPDYFFDVMQMYELNEILKNYQYHFRNEFEQTRIISYVIAQSNSTKKLKSTDVLKFEWDNTDINDTEKKQFTKEDIEMYRAKAKEIIKTNFIMK